MSSTLGTNTGSTTTISSGGLTKDNTLALSGTVSDANGVASVHIFDGATDLGAATVSSGNWSFTTAALSDGSHSFTAVAADNAGNVTTTSPAVTATVDTTAPTETMSSTLGTNTGSTTTISSGGLTKDNTLALSGTVSDANGVASVHIFDGATDLGAATVSSGNWSFTTAALSDGSHSFTAVAADNAGNVTTTSPAVTATVDTTADAAPLITFSGVNSHTGNNVNSLSVTISNIDSDLQSMIVTVSDQSGHSVSHTLTASEINTAKTNGTITISGSSPVWGSLSDLKGNQSMQASASVTDAAGNNVTRTETGTFPAGVAGAPIDLGLEGAAIPSNTTIHIGGMPSGWSLSSGTQNIDGSWSFQYAESQYVTVQTPLSFVGAVVLTIGIDMANPDGSLDTFFENVNIEAFGVGSPIFAWSADDHLSGSSGHDLFVFSKPIGNDFVHSFEVSSDVIDLISYGWQSFADVQAHTADDASGNAVITLIDGQTITLDGVHAADLTAANFEFDVTPTVENPGPMTIGDGSMLPLSGIINNTGEIDLQGSGDDTLLQLIQTGIKLEGGGHVVLSDDDHNIIAGTASNVTLDNVDNIISGAGQIGQGSLMLSNEGTIDATGTHALVIDTGANVIANAGTLEATGAGGLVLASAVTNSGLIWANGGTVTAEGEVTGNGNALISGAGTIEFGAGSTAGVTFDANAAGHLILDDAFHFSGTVSGLDGNDDIDIKGLGSGAGTTLSFTENQAGTGGTLTVSDGAHTANIVLLGQYDPTGFAEKADATNGTVITYDPHHIA
ncbi:beta strand repeat-containing protein [Bradyrhizobium sp. JR3.5]